MAVEAEEVRELIDFEPEGYLVTSFYLNLDAGEFPSDDLMETSFHSTYNAAFEEFKSLKDTLSHESMESLRQDLERIRTFWTDGFNRENTNGLAIFSCSALDFWEVVTMPTTVRSEVFFSQRPRISQIATFLSQTKATAILLTDRQNARILTMKGGEIREWADFDSPMIARSQPGGWSQSRYQRRSNNFAKHHIDKAAELVLKLSQHYPFDWLILGTEVQSEDDLEQGLHPYVKDKVIGTIHTRIDADTARVLEEAEQVREQAQAAHIDNLIHQIQEYAGAGGRGTIGLKETLQGLNEQKIHILLVQEGYTTPGAECHNCGLLMPSPKANCPACNEEATPIENVVEAAIQKAL